MQPRDHHPRAGDQRQQRPAAVRVGRAVRDRGLPDDLARRASSAPSRTWTRSRPTLAERLGRGLRARAGRERLGRGRRAASVGARMSVEQPAGSRQPTGPRHPLARQPGRRDAAIEGRPFRERKPPWLKVPAPGGPTYRQAEEGDRGRQPAHGLRGGELPERRRVLGARHGDVHDPRRRLHPPLRLLQRADGRADLERPARAAAGRDPGQEDGPAPRGHHLGRPRRPARLRRRRLRRRDPLDPDAWRRAARSRS